MTFAMLNRALGPHNCEFADAMYNLLGDNFTFIEIGNQDAQHASYQGAFSKLDYFRNRPYLLKMFESGENTQKAYWLIDNVDVLRTVGEFFPEVTMRILSGKLTFSASERIFKKWSVQMLYVGFRMAIHYRKMNCPNYRYLAMSAFLANDLHLMGAFKNRCYKFAYFTKQYPIDIDSSFEKRKSGKLKMVWCARFIDWKHPEMPLKLAESLVKSGRHSFEIKMIGADSTALWKEIKNQVISKGLEKYVELTGGVSNDIVQKTMQESNIFLFTSDRGEGWGAVLNEAMSAGCACVASHEIGAVPFLLKDEENGLIFKSCSVDSMFGCVARLYDDRSFCEKLGRNAISTITTNWSAETAAKRLVELSDSILRCDEISFEDGPCSKALPCRIKKG